MVIIVEAQFDTSQAYQRITQDSMNGNIDEIAGEQTVPYSVISLL